MRLVFSWIIIISLSLLEMNVVLASPDVIIDHSASTINKISSDMVVVVSKQSAINKLDDKNIANIFLTRTNRYPNGRKAIPIELSGSEFRNDFYQEISGKTPMELTAYWTTLIFSGKGRPPKGYGDIASLIKRLEKTPTAISYISLAQVTDSLKVVYQFP